MRASVGPAASRGAGTANAPAGMGRAPSPSALVDRPMRTAISIASNLRVSDRQRDSVAGHQG